jgi:hypothetical protein
MANQYQPLQDAMEEGLKSIVGNLIDGSIEDLDGPIRLIAQRLTMAARRKRMDLVEASKDQLALIVLEKRLRVEQMGSDLVGQLLGMGVDALIGGAIGGLGSLRRL